jgi:hypothetical protein
MATTTKTYDIVLFGVTGFTGKCKRVRRDDSSSKVLKLHLMYRSMLAVEVCIHKIKWNSVFTAH